jgi:hypothetical protein
MSGTDSDEDRVDELTVRYRAASAADPARPSDAARESVFAYARIVAADRTTRVMRTARMRRSTANDPSWRLGVAASVLVAGLATLLAWHSHAPAPFLSTQPSSAAADVAATNKAAEGPTASSQPPQPFPAEGRAGATPAPNAVTARSRERVNASAAVPSPRHEATADEAMEGARVASARQVPARIAGGSENATATAQLAPSPAAAPPNLQAPRSPAEAAASARSSAALDSPLVTAAESGNLARVDQLLRSGSGTEQTDARGRTALLVATLRGDVTMVRRLLADGARADAADADGDTPLAAARRQGSPELVSLLEQATHP